MTAISISAAEQDAHGQSHAAAYDGPRDRRRSGGARSRCERREDRRPPRGISWIGCGQCPACQRNEEQYCNRPRNLGCSANTPGGYATHVMVPHARYLLDYGNAPALLAAAYMCSGLTALWREESGQARTRRRSSDPGLRRRRHDGAAIRKKPVRQRSARRRHRRRAARSREEGRRQGDYNTKDPASAKKLMADTRWRRIRVIDFVGSEATFAFANAAVRRGGRIIIVGLFGGAMSMPLPMFPLAGAGRDAAPSSARCRRPRK